MSIAYEFKQQCEQADTCLRKIVSKPYKTAEKESDYENTEIYVAENDFKTDSDEDYIPTKSTRKTKENVTKSKKAGYECNVCYKVMKTKRGLKIHMAKHQDEADDLDDFDKIVSEEIVRTEVKVTMDDEKHICDICGAFFNEEKDLDAHQLEHKLEDLKNDLDSNTFDVEKGDEDDEMEKEEDLEEEEEEGDEEADDYFGDKDAKKSRAQQKGLYECKFCYKVLTTSMGMKIHLRRHTGRDLYDCQVRFEIICLKNNFDKYIVFYIIFRLFLY